MSATAVTGLTVPLDLRLRIADLYGAYADALDDGDYEAWPEFFLADCLYKVIPRENFERNLPIAPIYCESRGMLQDRVVALRQTAVFAPRLVRHLVGVPRIRALDAAGIRVTASFVLFESMVDQPSQVFLCGKYHDLVVEDGDTLRFAEKLCVYDSTIIPTSLVYPV
jgi:salicylate 5-hydroxylase small subunit